MVKIYWNTNPASVAVSNPNTHVKPNKGDKMMQALNPSLDQNQHARKSINF